MSLEPVKNRRMANPGDALEVPIQDLSPALPLAETQLLKEMPLAKMSPDVANWAPFPVRFRDCSRIHQLYDERSNVFSAL